MPRPVVIELSLVISTRLDKKMHCILSDIAALETVTSGRKVSVQELIRNALNFTYCDGERLRECFRRSRAGHTKRRKKNT